MMMIRLIKIPKCAHTQTHLMMIAMMTTSEIGNAYLEGFSADIFQKLKHPLHNLYDETFDVCSLAKLMELETI